LYRAQRRFPVGRLDGSFHRCLLHRYLLLPWVPHLAGLPLSLPLKMAAPSGRFGFAQCVVVPPLWLLTFGRFVSRFTGSLVALQSFLRPFAPPGFRSASSLLWPLLTPALARASSRSPWVRTWAFHPCHAALLDAS